MIVRCQKWPQVGERIQFVPVASVLSSWHNSIWNVVAIESPPVSVHELLASYSPPRWEMKVALSLVEAPRVEEAVGFVMNGVKLKKTQGRTQSWIVLKEVSDDEARVVQEGNAERASREDDQITEYRNMFGRIRLRNEGDPPNYRDFQGGDE